MVGLLWSEEESFLQAAPLTTRDTAYRVEVVRHERAVLSCRWDFEYGAAKRLLHYRYREPELLGKALGGGSRVGVHPARRLRPRLQELSQLAVPPGCGGDGGEQTDLGGSSFSALNQGPGIFDLRQSSEPLVQHQIRREGLGKRSDIHLAGDKSCHRLGDGRVDNFYVPVRINPSPVQQVSGLQIEG